MVESLNASVRYFYGADPSQFADLYLPAGRRRASTVVLIHGGWWGRYFGLDHLANVATDLASRGWVTWNIEYRRVGIGGGYPATLEDAAAAIDHMATIDGVNTDRVVTMGHSAGGHLATWAAGRSKLPAGAPGAEPLVDIAGVISLAGVVDLAAAARERNGNGAAIALMGGSPSERPQWYAVADPLAQIPIAAVVRCVHAQADDEVPFSESVTYVTAAQAAGQDAQLIEATGDHYSVADASSADWPTVINALKELEIALGAAAAP
jgi:acetyl esterase/lipase